VDLSKTARMWRNARIW